jgi:hypothetical protein
VITAHDQFRPDTNPVESQQYHGLDRRMLAGSHHPVNYRVKRLHEAASIRTRGQANELEDIWQIGPL